MPQKVLRFTGINRKVNEFNGAGACEELINLRPTASGLEVVKPKLKKFSNWYHDVYVHSFSDKSFFIGVLTGQGIEIVVFNEDGSLNYEIDRFEAGEDYSIAFLGNQILLSASGVLHVYEYKDNIYKKTDANFPLDLDVKYSVTVGSGSGYAQDASLDSADPRGYEFKNAALQHWSAALEQNKLSEYIFGPVLVAFNFALRDGTELWTNKWLYVNPFLSIDGGRRMIYYEDGDKGRFVFDSRRLMLTISQTEISVAGIDNMVEAINVYASRPIFPFDIESMASDTGPHDFQVYANAQGLVESKITDQLLYFQKRIPISKVESSDYSFYLNFGRSQAGERVLEVDNGTTKRVGKMVAYNNRVHVYESTSTIYPQSVTCESSVGEAFYERAGFVCLECNDTTVVQQVKVQVPVYSTSNGSSQIYCCYPDARAKKIYISNERGYYTCVNLRQSDRYNYAYGEATYTSSGDTVTSSLPEVTLNVIKEPNSINVSAQFNPFVFPVEYSYSIGGRILDVTTSYLPISSTQIGQYPIMLFTAEGVFALEQGSGKTLYGSVVPLQPMIIEGRATSTPAGTFFVSSNNLYLLVGRDAVNVSSVLNGERETNVRENDAYQKLCCSDGIFHNFRYELSQTDFENLIPYCTLTYDQLNNELYISDQRAEGVSYSYVFNIDTKSFHKVSKKYSNPQNKGRFAKEVYGNQRYVVDMNYEEHGSSMSILLQSRPLSLEALSTHIQRLMLLVDAKLSGDEQNLCFSVFGSDNLYDWKCIISSQKHNTVLRHIRTNKAAKSYKEYIILITGTVDTHTDISDIIADYTVVNRRLG